MGLVVWNGVIEGSWGFPLEESCKEITVSLMVSRADGSTSSHPCVYVCVRVYVRNHPACIPLRTCCTVRILFLVSRGMLIPLSSQYQSGNRPTHEICLHHNLQHGMQMSPLRHQRSRHVHVLLYNYLEKHPAHAPPRPANPQPRQLVNTGRQPFQQVATPPPTKSAYVSTAQRLARSGAGCIVIGIPRQSIKEAGPALSVRKTWVR